LNRLKIPVKIPESTPLIGKHNDGVLGG